MTKSNDVDEVYLVNSVLVRVKLVSKKYSSVGTCHTMGNQGSSAHEPFDRAAQAAANTDLKMVHTHLIKPHLQFIIQLESLNRY